MLFIQIPRYGRIEHTEAPVLAGAHTNLVYYAMNLQTQKQALKAVVERDSIYGLPNVLEGADY